jgi:hypothetical protein
MFKINADTTQWFTPSPIASPNACWPASLKGKAQIAYDLIGIVCKIDALSAEWKETSPAQSRAFFTSEAPCGTSCALTGEDRRGAS